MWMRAQARLGLMMAGILGLASGCSTYQPTGEPGVWRDGEGHVVEVVEAEAVQPAPAPPPERAPAVPYRLQTGDVLSVHVDHQTPVVQPEVLVGPDGRISLPLIGTLDVGGHTLDEVRARITKLYEEFLVEAKVCVNLRKFRARTCAVLGQIRRPGSQPVEGGLTLLDAIAAAGGFVPDTADISGSYVSRRGSRLPVSFEALFLQGDLSQNVALLPGDLVYVPRTTRREVIVLGYVRAAGIIPLDRPHTVLSAVGQAGGFDDLARLKNIAVVRNITAHPLVRIVDVEAILSGRATDFQLADGDVVYVPRDDLRALDIPDMVRQSSAIVAGIAIGDAVSDR